MATLNLEQKEVVYQLKNHELISDISYTYYKVSVLFKTGIKERWLIRDRLWIEEYRPWGARPTQFTIQFPQSGLIKNQPKEYTEFEVHSLDEKETEFLKPFFIYTNYSIKKAGFIDVRLMVHSVITKLVEEGWMPIKYPQSFLARDLRTLNKYSPNKYYINSTTMTAFVSNFKNEDGNKYMSGRSIAEHFLDWGNEYDDRITVKDAWRSPARLWSSLQYILSHDKHITRSNILKSFNDSRPSGPKFIDPGFWRTIIGTYFRAAKNVYDHCPGVGCKMMAVSLLEKEYIPNTDRLNDMAKFIGCSIGGRKDKYDLVILSDNVAVPVIEANKLLEQLMKTGKHTMIAVDSVDGIKFKPKRILDIYLKPCHECSKLLIY